MISVTAAAHSFRRTSRSMGTHLKAFGSGRVALSAVDENEEQPKIPTVQSNANFLSTLRNIVTKIWCALLNLINAVCPFFSLYIESRPLEAQKLATKTKTPNTPSLFDLLEDKMLLRIFELTDGETIMNLEATCSSLRRLIREHNDRLPKIQKDQVKLYFDEGEVIVVPVDERRVPSRYPMPSVEHLASRLRRISTSSLFIRGLIPAETVPVLRRLCRFHLSASQIYFLWCEFDEEAEKYLCSLFESNALVDLGFEACTPSALISDSLLRSVILRLNSLRCWHDNLGGFYGISDETLFLLADQMKRSECPLETLDLSTVRITVSGLGALIDAWYRQPSPTHLCLSLHNCGLERHDLVEECRNRAVPLREKGGLESRGFRLTLHIT